MKKIYKVVYKSTGIVAFKSTQKKFCQAWIEDNNFDEDGNDLNLYKLVLEEDT